MCIVFQRDELCTNHKNTPYIFTVLYLILIHLWNKSTYKIHLLLQVWNEIIADNEHKLGKLGESKVHSHDGQWRGIVMFTPTLRCECAQPGLIDTIWEWDVLPPASVCASSGRCQRSRNYIVHTFSHMMHILITSNCISRSQATDLHTWVELIHCAVSNYGFLVVRFGSVRFGLFGHGFINCLASDLLLCPFHIDWENMSLVFVK